MRLEIADGTIKINSYEYRDRLDIDEVMIPDSVKLIGEGAFKGCRNVKQIVVGRNVSQVQMYAFDGIGKNLDIVWLSSMAYKSPFMKILPPYEDIDSICAPKRAFSKAGAMEKRALFCGYLLHPEWEKEFSSSLKEEYEVYLKEEFLGYLNELCDRGIIMNIFLACYKRGMLKDTEVAKKFISYIRSHFMTKAEKERIDSIEQELGLFEAQEEVFEKRIRRYVREQMTDKMMIEILGKEGILDVPMIKGAPVEAIKFIFASYILQWTYLENRPLEFHMDEKADYVAGLLNRVELKKCLEEIAKDSEISYPRRMIPFLRYADEEQLSRYIERAKSWTEYDMYGEAGILAKETFEKGILLNDSKTALLYVYQNGSLEQYGLMRKTNVEELMLAIVGILVEKQLEKELLELKNNYVKKLHVDYLSGKKIKKNDWEHFHMSHPILREIGTTLVWEKGQKNSELFVVSEDDSGKLVFRDEKGKDVFLEDGCEIGIAHPVYMEKEQIREFRRLFKNQGKTQCFYQLRDITLRLDLGEWALWNRRYYKMRVSYERLQSLVDRGFKLDGRISERLRLSYYGKVLMEAYPTEENDVMEFGYILGSNYNMREINESCSILDDAFCYEMILGGRMEAGPYLDQFNRKQIQSLLEASIELKHHENVAALLERKMAMSDDEEDDDLSLAW